MATVTSLDTDAVALDRTWQRNTSTAAWAYGRVTASIVEETATSVTIAVGGALMYGGYDNYVPWDIGVRQVFEDGTRNTEYNSGVWTRTTSAQMNNWIWMTEAQFTFQKTSSKFGLLPFIKIGCIEYGDDNYVAGNDWMFGSDYGILVGYRFADTCLKGTMTHTSSINGRVRELPAFIVFAGNNNTDTGYDNAQIIIEAAGGVYVYNSSGVPKRATAIYVYNSSGAPKLATTVTVYDSSGNPHTVSC